MEHLIPEATHDLARYWLQPSRAEITICSTHVTMSPSALSKLSERNPGQLQYWPGQMWKSFHPHVRAGKPYESNKNHWTHWLLFWCQETDSDQKIKLACRRIFISSQPQGAPREHQSPPI